VAHDLDLKWLLRQLASTRVYQRSSVLPPGETPPAEELFLVAKERPLCAEQLARAFLRATGEWDRVSGNAKADAADEARRYDLKEFLASFRTAFANAPREPELTVNPTLRSALFLRNSEPVQWSVRPRPGNLVERLTAIPDAAALAEELFLSAYSRPPTPEESADIAGWLARHSSDRPRAVGDAVWALVSSAEFFSNH
jgi:hypothetical protein